MLDSCESCNNQMEKESSERLKNRDIKWACLICLKEHLTIEENDSCCKEIKDKVMARFYGMFKDKEQDANIDTFQECSECSRKQINPESLLLCPGCLSNRSIISFLNRTIELQESTIKRLKEESTDKVLIEALLNLLIVKLPYKGYSVYLGRFGLKEKNGIIGKEWRPAGYYYDEDSYDKCREEIREYVLKLYKEDMSNL